MKATHEGDVQSTLTVAMSSWSLHLQNISGNNIEVQRKIIPSSLQSTKELGSLGTDMLYLLNSRVILVLELKDTEFGKEGTVPRIDLRDDQCEFLKSVRRESITEPYVVFNSRKDHRIRKLPEGSPFQAATALSYLPALTPETALLARSDLSEYVGERPQGTSMLDVYSRIVYRLVSEGQDDRDNSAEAIIYALQDLTSGDEVPDNCLLWFISQEGTRPMPLKKLKASFPWLGEVKLNAESLTALMPVFNQYILDLSKAGRDIDKIETATSDAAATMDLVLFHLGNRLRTMRASEDVMRGIQDAFGRSPADTDKLVTAPEEEPGSNADRPDEDSSGMQP